MIIGVETEKDKSARKTINELDKRLQGEGVAFNMFIDSEAVSISDEFHIIRMNSIYPNFSIVLFALSLINLGTYAFIFPEVKILLWGVCIFFVLGLLNYTVHSTLISKYALKKALQKNGYKGKVKYLSKEETIKELLFSLKNIAGWI